MFYLVFEFANGDRILLKTERASDRPTNLHHGGTLQFNQGSDRSITYPVSQLRKMEVLPEDMWPALEADSYIQMFDWIHYFA